MNNLIQISNYIVESFIHTWPYLLVTIPIAVIVKMSGASRYINRAFTTSPLIAILLSTLVGAFSPLCSCSVIPVVASLLIGGVPLAPVMSFWLASPSMDPEIFFLTVSSLGWELAIWRLAATLVMSLGGGFITHFMVQNNLLGKKVLRETQSTQIKKIGEVIKQVWQFMFTKRNSILPNTKVAAVTATSGIISYPEKTAPASGVSNCGSCSYNQPPIPSESCETNLKDSLPDSKFAFWKSLGIATWDATSMVVKFMLIAWFLSALIKSYVPDTWITSILGGDKPWAIITAAVLGIPIYTSNLTAVPLVGGLLAQGMNPAAALAFLIAGPTTTLPAMSAVWGLVNRKVFALYIGISLVGAVVLGYIYRFSL